MSPTRVFRVDKVTGGIRCCPEFVQDKERVNDTDDGLAVLTECGYAEIFPYAWNSVGIHRIADRAAKENTRLSFASNDKGRFRGCGRTAKQT